MSGMEVEPVLRLIQSQSMTAATPWSRAGLDAGREPGSGPFDHMKDRGAVSSDAQPLEPLEQLIEQAVHLFRWWHQTGAYREPLGQVSALFLTDCLTEGEYPDNFNEKECDYEHH